VISGGTARQSTLQQVLAIVQQLQVEVSKLVTQDATIAAIAADLSADATKQTAALGTIQALVSSLQAEVAAGGASPATVAALQAAQAAEDAFTTSIQSSATPPSSLWPIHRSSRQPKRYMPQRMYSPSWTLSSSGSRLLSTPYSGLAISREPVGNRSHHRWLRHDSHRLSWQPAWCACSH
jgi:hypothetical protein